MSKKGALVLIAALALAGVAASGISQKIVRPPLPDGLGAKRILKAQLPRWVLDRLQHPEAHG
jgi:hypothetical protein